VVLLLPLLSGKQNGTGRKSGVESRDMGELLHSKDKENTHKEYQC
jgi:hypothetical protein